MFVYQIRGFTVNFPYSAYDCQLVYMEKVLQSIQAKQPALLESPTGTGKTLCLLCAVLAWNQANPQSKSRIIYSSRTHSQLAKVLQELKATNFKPRVAILGSRQQLCVHPTVSAIPHSAQQNQACRHLTVKHACKYQENLSNFLMQNATLRNEILDLEDLLTIGRDHTICPYFFTREQLQEAELILMPYNYLVDSSIRNRLQLNLENSILIFDEAHNLESVCSESASFDLTATEIAQAILEVQKAIETAQIEAAYYEQANGGQSVSKIDLTSLTLLKGLLLEFEQNFLSEPFSTRSGSYMLDFLARCKITHETRKFLMDLLEKTVETLFEVDSSSISSSSGGAGEQNRKSSALDKLIHCFRLIFKGSTLQETLTTCTYYKFHLHSGKSSSHSSSSSSYHKQGNNSRILSYWCFSPGIAMLELALFHSLRTIILTSGTLSPLNSFAAEFQLTFPIRLENPHIIDTDQVWCGIIENGPNTIELISNYENRSSEKYLRELGACLIYWASIVPDGMLVFFPSYWNLNFAIDYWQREIWRGRGDGPVNSTANSIWDRLSQIKTLVMEPKHSSEFQASLLQFQEKLNDRSGKMSGAIFFAVCRGKVSEGLDFADRAGRAVVVTGLPFPALMDDKVKLKRQFLDEQAAAAAIGKKIEPAMSAPILPPTPPPVPGMPTQPGQVPPPTPLAASPFIPSTATVASFTGSVWYSQQACRAINQAIGRVIRHRHDYGAIILADSRFAHSAQMNQLSAWLRPRAKKFDNFNKATASLASFFQQAKKRWPESQEKITIVTNHSNSSASVGLPATNQRMPDADNGASRVKLQEERAGPSDFSHLGETPQRATSISLQESYKTLASGLGGIHQKVTPTVLAPPAARVPGVIPGSDLISALHQNSKKMVRNDSSEAPATVQANANAAPTQAKSIISLSERLMNSQGRGNTTATAAAPAKAPSATGDSSSSDVSSFLARANSILSPEEFTTLRSLLHRSLKLKEAAAACPISGNTTGPEAPPAITAFTGSPLHRCVALHFELLSYRFRELLVKPSAPERLELAETFLLRLPGRFRPIFAAIVLDKIDNPPSSSSSSSTDEKPSSSPFTANDFISSIKSSLSLPQYKEFKQLIVQLEGICKEKKNSSEDSSSIKEILQEKCMKLYSILAEIKEYSNSNRKIIISAPVLYLKFIPRGLLGEFRALMEKSLNSTLIEQALSVGMKYTTGTTGPAGLGAGAPNSQMNKRDYSSASTSSLGLGEKKPRF